MTTAYADTHNWLPRAEPHLPPFHDPEIVLAIRAWSMGTATAEQQKLSWRYLMYVAKASDEFQDLSYRPGDKGTLATAFAEGSKFVGLMVRKLLRPEFTPKHVSPKGLVGSASESATPSPRMTRSQRKKRKQQRTP